MTKQPTPLAPHQMAKKSSSSSKNPRKKQPKEIANVQKQQQQQKPHSWALMRSFFTCKHLQAQIQQQQQQQETPKPNPPRREQKKKPGKQEQQLMDELESNKKCKKMKCSGSLCNNTKVMHRPEPSSSSSLEEQQQQQQKKRAASSSMGSTKSPTLNKAAANNNGAVNIASSSSSSLSLQSSNSTGSLRGMPFRKLSGCYECRMVIDPVLMMTRDPSLKATICSCPHCGEIFMKPEHLELHQAVRHAVSELGPDDTSKNIVEIIFQSSWLKKQLPVCKIERILKVHNTPKTIARFEEYRESIKAKATKLQKKQHARCIADGNELLRFHCTTFKCSLGLNGSSNLCNSIPSCNACSIIRHGFKTITSGDHDAAASGNNTAANNNNNNNNNNTNGILTTATSGKAHDNARLVCDDEKRAMLVCRVIAGRVKKNMDGSLEEYDSVAGAAGMYSNLDELYVFNPKAILPCFVVIYGGY